MKERVNIYDAKAHLSKIINRVQETGESVTICKNGKPVVDLIRHPLERDPLKVDAKLLGAVYDGNPCAEATAEDWPESLR